MKRAMIGSRAFVLDKDKADEFLRQKSDKKAIERIYRNADKFEKNNTNHIYSKGYNKAIDDFAEELKKYTYGRTNCVYVEIPMYKVEEIVEQLKME